MEENFTTPKSPAGIMSSQQKAAKVAGIALLLSIALIVYANFGLQSRLVIEGDIAKTASNILANENLFRLVIVCHLIYCAGIVILLTAFYIVLKPVSPALALFAALSRFIFALVWIIIVLNFLTALHLLGEDYLKVLEADRRQALAKLYLTGWDAYYVGLLFWSLASTVCGWLWLKSKYIPRIFALFGLVASAWCVACTLAYLIFPSFSETVNLWWFDSPMTIFEIALSFWLLFRGIRVTARDK